MENNNGSCEIVYKAQTHEFSIDASQLLVLVKIFFLAGWKGGAHQKKFSGMWDLKLPDQGFNPSPLHWKHRVLTAGPPGKSLLVKI